MDWYHLHWVVCLLWLKWYFRTYLFLGSKANGIKWKHIKPLYVGFKGSFGEEKVKTIDLSTIGSSIIELSCDVFVSSSALSRAWFIIGVDQIDQRDELKIALNISSLKSNDKVDCRVSLKVGQLPKQYTWLFRSYELSWLFHLIWKQRLLLV